MESRAYSNLADLHSMDANYQESASYYTKSIALCKELGDQFLAAKNEVSEDSEEYADCEAKVHMCRETEGKSYADLAAVHHELGESATAMSDMERAIELAEEVHDSQAVGERLTQLAALKMFDTEKPVDNAECEVLLSKSVNVWRQYAIQLRQMLLNDLENEDIENPDLCNTRAAQFFEQHASTYASLQKVLIAQGKNQEALVVAEEGRTQALYDLLQLSGEASPVNPACAPMTFEDMKNITE